MLNVIYCIWSYKFLTGISYALPRDECNRLTKLIQSRVIEAPFTGVVEGGTHKGTSDRATSSATAFLGAWQSLNQNLLESIQYSASKLNAFSPGYSAIQACTPDLRDTAVMEAKKWLEEKRLASSSKHTFDCGPCTLNTDRLQYVSIAFYFFFLSLFAFLCLKILGGRINFSLYFNMLWKWLTWCFTDMNLNG